MNYVRKYRADIDDLDFIRLLLKWPGVRNTALLWWQHSTEPARKLELLRDFVRSSEIVDDRALIDVAVALVSARLPANVRTWRLLEDICNYMKEKSTWGFYAKTWILSKYGTADELIRVLDSTSLIWVTEEYLSRLVAGLYPRLVNTAHEKRFMGLITRSGNRWCQDVMRFHERISTTPQGFNSVFKFIRAVNPSQPNRITHAKFLMLCSLMRNPNVAVSALKDLSLSHAFALEDPYYSMIVAP